MAEIVRYWYWYTYNIIYMLCMIIMQKQRTEDKKVIKIKINSTSQHNPSWIHVLKQSQMTLMTEVCQW